jgi:hypothetical protein
MDDLEVSIKNLKTTHIKINNQSKLMLRWLRWQATLIKNSRITDLITMKAVQIMEEGMYLKTLTWVV